MARRLMGAFALTSLSAVSAFRDTSPFMLFSTSELLLPLDGGRPELAKSSDVTQSALSALKDCPSDAYFIVKQNGAAASDYLDSRSAPYLSHRVGQEDKNTRSAVTIPEVLGDVDVDSITKYLADHCGAQKWNIEAKASSSQSTPLYVEHTFNSLAASNRAPDLVKNDAYLNKVVSNLGLDKHTVIYITSPQTEELTEASYNAQYAEEIDDAFLSILPESIRMELKRDIESHTRATSSERGLFEKYQFLSPGIFMGLVAILPLFLILYVGITAISSLQVSYFAFSKEMGPAQQKKQ